MKYRNRLIHAALVLFVVALGLATRKYSPLSSIIPASVGDMLWALMVFLIFGFLLPYQTTKRLGIYALTFAFCIELSQLYQAAWIDAIRHNRLGGLVLGHGFLWSDLLAYIAGISLGALGEITVSLTRNFLTRQRPA